jgi:hypothetical protein
MKYRLLNKLYAHLFGYFWLPCPQCGQFFGGHEWRYVSQHNNEGKGICMNCYTTLTAQGRG